MPSLSLISLNHLHLPKCLRSLLNGDDLEFCGSERDRRNDDDSGDGDDDADDLPDRRTFSRTNFATDDQIETTLNDASRRVFETGIATVTLAKTPGSILGLTVVGGTDKGWFIISLHQRCRFWKVPRSKTMGNLGAALFEQLLILFVLIDKQLNIFVSI